MGILRRYKAMELALVHSKNLIDINRLSSVTIIDANNFQTSKWAGYILTNPKVLEIFKPSTIYYYKCTYTLVATGTLPVTNEIIRFNLFSASAGSLVFGTNTTLIVVGDSITVAGQFTTPSTLSDRQLLVYTKGYSSGTLGTVKFTNLIISTTDIAYVPYF